MRKIKSLTIFIAIIIIFPSLNIITIAKEEQEKIDEPLTDFLRGYKIDFEPPEIIQDCGSAFFLNVTILSRQKLINRPILNRPIFILVFLRIGDPSDNNIIRIGSKKLIYLSSSEEKTISIPCLTTNKLFSIMDNLRTEKETEYNIFNGAIGVKIEKLPRLRFFTYFVDQLKYNRLFTDGFYWDWILDYKPPVKSRSENNMKILSFLYNCLGLLKNCNNFIVWKDVDLTKPITCSNDIQFEYVKVQEETDDGGNFNVILKIRNDLEDDVNVCVLVDLSVQSFFNSLIPLLSKGKMYNVGWFEEVIPAGNSIYKKINCSFPDGYFYNQNYSITIECGPFIFIDNTSRFGRYFYDYRFIKIIKPKYILNETVLHSIRKVWYNTPIFYGDPDSKTMFLVSHNITFYNGDTLIDEVAKGGKKIFDELSIPIFLMILSILLLYGLFMGFINWIVRKKSK